MTKETQKPAAPADAVPKGLRVVLDRLSNEVACDVIDWLQETPTDVSRYALVDAILMHHPTEE